MCLRRGGVGHSYLSLVREEGNSMDPGLLSPTSHRPKSFSLRYAFSCRSHGWYNKRALSGRLRTDSHRDLCRLVLLEPPWAPPTSSPCQQEPRRRQAATAAPPKSRTHRLRWGRILPPREERPNPRSKENGTDPCPQPSFPRSTDSRLTERNLPYSGAHDRDMPSNHKGCRPWELRAL
jgi:hypothetical protein